MSNDTTQGVLLRELAELPADTWVDRKALARLLQVSERTIGYMVSRGELPPGLRNGMRTEWKVGHVRDWRDERALALAEERQAERARLDGYLPPPTRRGRRRT